MGSRGARSSPNPATNPRATSQYSSGGFSNQGSPQRRGVIQSPDSAISLPIDAYRGSSALRTPVAVSP